MSDREQIYGSNRVRGIRIALGVAVAVGIICGGFAILIAVESDEEGAGVFAAVLGIVAAGSIAWPLISWRLLATPNRAAKRAVIVTGILLLLFAPVTFGLFGLGLMSGVLGLLLLFLALSTDPEAGG